MFFITIFFSSKINAKQILQNEVFVLDSNIIISAFKNKVLCGKHVGCRCVWCNTKHWCLEKIIFQKNILSKLGSLWKTNRLQMCLIQ